MRNRATHLSAEVPTVSTAHGSISRAAEWLGSPHQNAHAAELPLQHESTAQPWRCRLIVAKHHKTKSFSSGFITTFSIIATISFRIGDEKGAQGAELDAIRAEEPGDAGQT